MYALVELYHECKTSEIEVSLKGVYDTSSDAFASLNMIVDERRSQYSDPLWAVYGDGGYVKNESCDLWEWMVLDSDNKMRGLYMVGAYEFGFDEED